MTSILRLILFTPSLFACIISHAQFETVQIPDDMDFECDPEGTVERCVEELAHEIWYVTYYDQVQLWKEELFFNTNIYFHPYEQTFAQDGSMGSYEVFDFLDNGSLIDVRYSGYKKLGWAFAIDVVCEKGWQFYGENCVPKLRLMDFGGEGEWPDILPKNIRETVAHYGAQARWLEADIRSCDSALDQLLAFPKTAKTKDFWNKDYVEFLKGKEIELPDEIIVTADGDGVLIRARGYANPTSKNVGRLGEKFVMHNDRNGGPGYNWALEMKDIVEPCLKPSTATPPWEKVLAHQAKNE